MTKVMFQVGLLGFFVSVLYFGTQGIPLMDMVVRSFIVFIAIVLGQAVIFVVLASMKHAPKGGAAKPRCGTSSVRRRRWSRKHRRAAMPS